ncbi:hypothetical protein SB748_36015, partial [Rhizobium sp. SIMBA_035]
DLSLLYEELEDNIIFTVFYNENYHNYVIESLLKNFIDILLNYKDLLNKHSKEYSLIDNKERHQLLLEFNNTSFEYPKEKT